MDIAIAHLSLNFRGGEERLCLSLVEALKSSGHRVTLSTIERTDWHSLADIFGGIVKPDEEHCPLSAFMHTSLSKASAAALGYAEYLMELLRLKSNRGYDLVINTYGDLFNSIADVAYVHFPMTATVDYAQTPAFVSPLRWIIYCQAYNLITAVLDNVRPSFLLTNSKFTQQVVRKYLRRDATVLHPPVDVHKYTSKVVKRENRVMTVSKFTPKRQLYKIPFIAKKTRYAHYLIAGEADEYSSKTIEDLRILIDKCDVGNRVTLATNVPRPELIKLLGEAKAYLHVMPFDHFGISIVEAMSAGCIPIVHRSGGPWLDILGQQQGRIGYSYNTLEEAAQLIDHVMTDEDARFMLSLAAEKSALRYDKSAFQENLNDIVSRLGSRSGRMV
jgi:glycosyltransferase involved in cell wall biosynthesis